MTTILLLALAGAIMVVARDQSNRQTMRENIILISATAALGALMLPRRVAYAICIHHGRFRDIYLSLRE